MPELIRWPGHIEAGSVSNEIVQHHDWMPTFLAAAGEPDIVEKCKEGHQAGDKTFKVHIDGYNLLPYLTGEVASTAPARASSTSPTTPTCSACGSTTGRSCSWSSASQGTMQIWAEPFTDAARPEDLQPAHRSVRAGRQHVEHLLGLVHRPQLHRRLRDVSSSPSSWRRSRSSRPATSRRRSPSTTPSPSSTSSSPAADPRRVEGRPAGAGRPSVRSRAGCATCRARRWRRRP